MIASGTDGAYKGLSLQFILGLLFAPVAWLAGVPSSDLLAVGQLLCERLVLNEFFAYFSLKDLRAAGSLTNQQSIVIATYALCGFANLVSMGIQVGGIGALVPSLRPMLASLAFKALVGGTVACMLTACIAAFLV